MPDTPSERLAALEALLGQGKDSAMLRYAIGSEYYKQDNLLGAVENFASAIDQQEHYAAAWKMLGKCLSGLDRLDQAKAALETGIEIADSRGDIQASKEMTVFLRRVQKKLAAVDD